MIRPLDYADNLSLDEARDRYEEVKSAFAEVKRNYSGIKGWFNKNGFKNEMRDEHQKTLVDCVGVLLPLQMMSSVQAEVTVSSLSGRGINGTLLSQSTDLMSSMLNYQGRFRNTGVHSLGMFADEVA
ncbi:MAG: hypothetical protein Q7R87_00235 [Nanoarchaeota archaeon]|nr:hypothetical protein [Nanoarchaeota archaeon]